MSESLVGNPWFRKDALCTKDRRRTASLRYKSHFSQANYCIDI